MGGGPGSVESSCGSLRSTRADVSRALLTPRLLFSLYVVPCPPIDGWMRLLRLSSGGGPTSLARSSGLRPRERTPMS